MVNRLAAVTLLIVLAPLLALLGIAIAATGQPPLFLQDRIGLGGETFRIVKFRTFPSGGWEVAEACTGRIDLWRHGVFRAISRLLRASGLDELPQIVNVLKGDMAFIGPRPLMREDFQALPEGRELRCAVRPGITGLAQVHGGQRLGAREKLVLDLYFIENADRAMRTRIIWRSVMRLCGFNHIVELIDHNLVDRAGAALARGMAPAAQRPPLAHVPVTVVADSP